MADIAMCLNTECTLKDSCYRQTAKPGVFQYYSSFKQINGKCDYYYERQDS